jgi:hypothetical protein
MTFKYYETRLATIQRYIFFSLNIYYLFIKKQCFGKCALNLFAFIKNCKKNKSKMLFWQRKKVIEILIVSYLAYICLMPLIGWDK